MSKTLCIDFKTKDGKGKNRAAVITGTLYAELIEQKNEFFIKNVMVKLKKGTEFNTHQQKDDTSGAFANRREFAETFGFNYKKNSEKELIVLSDDQLEWLNSRIEEISTVKNIELILRGNWANGAQQSKQNDDIKIINSMYEGFTFLNLLSSMKVSSQKLKMCFFEIGEKLNMEQLVKELHVKKSRTVLPVFKSFFDSKKGNFYIPYTRDIIFSEYNVEDDINKVRARARFKMNMATTYELVDWIYGKFTNSSLVEAAHIKPVAHSTDESEMTDIENGLLLPIHLHKLFDNGSISFDENGKLIYIKKSNKRTIGVTHEEITFLGLDSIFINKQMITERRLKFLEYHRSHVYGIGI